jgi:hypothetical protein
MYGNTWQIRVKLPFKLAFNGGIQGVLYFGLSGKNRNAFTRPSFYRIRDFPVMLT